MTDTVNTIAEFITSHRITMTAERVDANPNMPDSGSMDHWKVQLTRRSQSTLQSQIGADSFENKQVHHVSRLTTYFSMGSGHGGKEPQAADVLDCLASDAAGVEDILDFGDWCLSYGYDQDSRKAEKTYKTCAHAAKRLKTFLGDAGYRELLYNTERM